MSPRRSDGTGFVFARFQDRYGPRRPSDDSVLLAVPRSELLCRNPIMGHHGAGAGHLPAPARGQPIDHWLALQQRRLQRVDRRIVPFHAQRHRELHRPLLFSDQVSALSILRGSAGLLILGIAIRLLMGVMLRAALDSVLAVGVLHQIFDASTNNGSLVDSVLDGADAGDM